MKKEGRKEKKVLNLIGNKILLGFTLFALIISQDGIGFVLAYNKLAQVTGNQDVNTAEEGIPENEDYTIGKFFRDRPPGSYIDTNGVLHTQKGSDINIQISFKGKIDINPNKSYVDVMLLIDRSMSMKSLVGPDENGNNCNFTGFDPASDPRQPNYIPKGIIDRGDYDNAKLCWAEYAAKKFIGLAANPKARFKIGYVTYGNDDQTKRETNSAYGDKGNAQYFKPLVDTWDDPENNVNNSANRVQIKNWLGYIGFHTGDAGTAMARATDIAIEELQKNGRGGTAKYIVILTDGLGNQQTDRPNNPENHYSSLTGCMSFRGSISDAWPVTTGYPPSYNKCSIPPGFRGNPGTKPRVPGDYRTYDVLSPPGLPPLYPAVWGDCCITKDLGQIEGFKSNGENRPVDVYPFNDSPMGRLLGKGIKAPTIGFGAGINTNLNVPLLVKIAEASHNYDGKEHYYFGNDPDSIIQAFEKIFFDILGDQGAIINFTETLPPGVDVDLNGGIQIIRNVADSEYCQPLYQKDRCRKPFNIITSGNSGSSDGNDIRVIKRTVNGRVVLEFQIVNENYDHSIPQYRKNFVVNLTLKTANASTGAFDLDQNRDCECGGGACPATPVSTVGWNFQWSQPALRTEATPKLCVNFSTAPYTGDVYGTSVGRYNFPFIDVLVSGGTIFPNSQAVWEISEYTFASGTYSKFSEYQNYLSSQINDMKARAEQTTLLTALTQRNDNDPSGKIFYVEGNQTLSDPRDPNNPRPINLGSGRRTVIINGDLTINQPIVKTDKESTAAIIVLGNTTTINPTAGTVQAGIVAPGLKTSEGLPPSDGVIKIVDSTNFLNVEGFLIGAQVNLKPYAHAITAQSIIYDIALTKFPPPGIAGLNLPIYQEIAP